MWFIHAIASVFFTALEETSDKAAVVRDKSIDTIAASFVRQGAYFFWFALAALLGVSGHVQLLITWPILLLVVLNVVSAIAYTYTLKRIEITSETAFSYLVPFLFLLTDVFVFHASLSVWQVIGIILLVCGGFCFTVEPGTFRFKKELTTVIWMIFAFDAVLGGMDYYIFRYYHASRGLSEVSFYFSIWGLMVIGILGYIIATGFWRPVISVARQHGYLKKVMLSKFFDAMGAWFWLRAIVLATVSQVNAAGAFFPVIMIIVVYVFQKILKLDVEERFSKGHLALKIIAVLLLVVGGVLAS